ncbi:MAG TPA: alpha/beta fold hydrolase [Gammaproteobacteria bacterium]
MSYLFRSIEFPSQNATLRGRLYSRPDAPQPAPVIIMAHGFSATIEGMVADRYAEVFCDTGFAVLLFEHRNFGISDGEPRQQINRWIQTRGYLDALDLVNKLDGIDADRIALWGDSMSGGEVIVLGAVDTRIKAVIAQVPACGDANAPPDPDQSLFKALRDTLLHGNVRATPENTTGPLPIVSSDQQSIPSLLTPLTAFRWFIEYGGRYGTGWQNSATLVVPNTPAPFHPGLCAPYLKAALLMMIARDDEMPGADSKTARSVFAAAPQPKELIEIDGGHFGLLHYPGKLFDIASSVQRDFLTRHLIS